MRKRAAGLLWGSFCGFILPLALTARLAGEGPVRSPRTTGWTDLSANVPGDPAVNLRDVHFVGQDGWIAGGRDVIYYTPDGGHSFTSQPLPAGSGITTSIFMRSATEGYVVTAGGKFLRSTDARNGNWQLLSYHTGVALNAVTFPPLPAATGYACGNSGQTFRINGDTVTSLNNISTAHVTSLCFPVNSDQGWLVAEGTLRHYDGSAWADDQGYDAGNNYNAIFMVDNLKGWVVCSSGIIIGTQNGKDWDIPQINADPQLHNLSDVFFINANEGWAAGESALLHTTDGHNWQIEAAGLTGGKILRAIFAAGSNAVYAVGNDRLLLKYGLPAQSLHLPLVVR